MKFRLLAAILVVLATAGGVRAQAQAAFPDFTPEANAKRDAKLKECLEANRLAPRESVSPGR